MNKFSTKGTKKKGDVAQASNHRVVNVSTEGKEVVSTTSSSNNDDQDTPSYSASMTTENLRPGMMLSHQKIQGDLFDMRGGSVSPTSSITSSIHDAYYLNDRIRSLESEKLALMIDHNNLIREFNKRMESHLEEIRNLKESNQNIEQEANELRDLCCFLDDDRQKCRKLAKEWQRFGKHTVAVMRNEVMSYQDKLRSLETRQSELIKENGELRDLCVYLDNQRAGSSSENDPAAMMKYSICKSCSELQKGQNSKESKGKNDDYAAEHVSRLQNQILQLEKEKDSLHKLLMYGGKRGKDKKRVSFSIPTDDEYDSSSTTSEFDRLDFPPVFGSSENFVKQFENNPNAIKNGMMLNTLQKPQNQYSDISPRNSIISRVADTVTEDQINEIKGKLSQSREGGVDPALSEQEISLLKDMCNVVSNKLRSDSNTSDLSSLNNSFDLTSPLSPPPLAFGIPLYEQRGESSGNDLKAGDLSSNTERKGSTSTLKNEEKSEQVTDDDMNNIDEIVESINTALAGSFKQLEEDEKKKESQKTAS